MNLNTIFTTFFFGLLTVVVAQNVCHKFDRGMSVANALNHAYECFTANKEFMHSGGQRCLDDKQPFNCSDGKDHSPTEGKQLSALNKEDCKWLSPVLSCMAESLKSCSNGTIIADIVGATYNDLLKVTPCSSSSKTRDL